MSFIQKLFSPEGFMPHGHCYLWETQVMWLHIVSDALITLAYLTIPVTLIHIARKRKDLPFDWVFACFGTFILACGATHALEVWTIWHPVYRLSGTLKAITAAASIATAVLLIRLIPQLLAIPSTAALRAANAALAKEVVERQRAETAIRELQLEHALVLNSISEGIHWIDKDGRIVFENPASARMLGWDAAELIGRPAHSTMHHTHANGTAYPQTECPIYASLRDGQPRSGIQEVFWRKDGTSFPVEYTSSSARNAAGEIAGTVVVFTDITVRKQAEQTVRESEERYRQLIETANEGIWTIDTEGRTTYVNQRMVDLLGYTRAEIPGRIHTDFMWEEDRPKGDLDFKLRRQGTPLVRDQRYRRKDHRNLWTVASCNGLFDPDGTFIGALGMFTDITERKQAEDSFRESAEKFRQLADNINDVFWIRSPDMQELHYVSPAFERIWGRSAETLYANPHRWTEFVFPEDREWVMALFATLTQDAPNVDVEYRIVRPTGEIRWIRSRGFQVRDAANNLVRNAGIVTDTTERKQIEDALRDSEERFASAFEHAPIGVALVSLDGSFLKVNRALCDFLGYSEGELLSRTFQEITYPEDLAADLEFVRQLIAGEIRSYEMEKRYVHQRGHILSGLLHGSLVRDGQGQPLYFIGQVQDITARTQAEAALRASEAEFRVLAEAMPQMIWVTRPDGWHTHFNQRWMDYTGLTLEESLGHGWLPPFHPEDQPIAAKRWQHANDTGDPYEIEYRLRGADGHYRWMLGRAVALRDESGQIVKWFGTCTDIHELKVAERTIQELNTDLEQRVVQRTEEFLAAAAEAERANRAKSEFLSRTSHELRTPLNAILGFGQLLEGEESLGAEPRESVEEILQAGRHLLSLVDEVLDISTADSGAMTLAVEPVPVDQLMTETLGLVGSQDGVLKIDVELASPMGGGWSVLADPQRLKQVLLNLLSNAIKYNRPGGKVIVKFAPVEAAGPSVFRFSVQDTGPGISPEKLPRLFTPFDRLDVERTRSHIAGTGLGLALARRMTELMGGRIGVESVQDEGSTFWVELPLAQSPAASIEQNGSIADPAPGFPPSRTLLYIEDNDSNLRLVTRILERRPAIHLLTATTGRLGLEMALEHRPDFILLDLNLPGLNGDEVLAELRADPRTFDIPVAMLTADGRPETRERMLAAGARAFLTKPFAVRDLLQVVDQWVPAPSTCR